MLFSYHKKRENSSFRLVPHSTSVDTAVILSSVPSVVIWQSKEGPKKRMSGPKDRMCGWV
jgi:hypothetical protein